VIKIVIAFNLALDIYGFFNEALENHRHVLNFVQYYLLCTT